MYNVEGIIKNNAVKLRYSKRDVEIAPDITLEMRDKWIRKYRDRVDASVGEKLIFLSNTGTGSIAAVGTGIYFDNFLQEGLQYIDFEDIASAVAVEGGVFKPDTLKLNTKNGLVYVLDGAIDGLNIFILSAIINKIVRLAEENGGNFISSKQDIALYEVSDELKLVYFKILCNYAYINDDLIDANEYSAIAHFIVRTELEQNARNDLRKYMNSISKRLKTGTFLKKAQELTKYETGQWDAFRYSLLQDVLFLHEIQNLDISWKNDGFIGSLLNHLGFCPAQVDTMTKAVLLNKRMQQKSCDYTVIRKEWLKLSKESKYSAGYVPMMYLFCSGSLYGVNKERYNTLFASNYNRQEGINKWREIILQEIIQNQQKAFNLLIDDYNELVELLEGAVKESEQVKAKYKVLIERLKKARNGVENVQLYR